MSKFMVRHVYQLTSLASSLYSNNHSYFLRIHRFSAKSLRSIESCSDRSSFTFNYLINSCGLVTERAFIVSKYVNFKVADKPNYVLTFFKEQGFTQTQISKIVNYYPKVLVCDPQKTLLPKLEYLKSRGISASELTEIVSRSPGILKSSLQNNLIPSFKFLSNYIHSEENIVAAFKRCLGPVWFENAKHIKVNIETLKQAGVPDKNIGYLVRYNPRTLSTHIDRFSEIVEKVQKLGFDPSKVDFVAAFRVFKAMSKSTWDRKAEAYKKWGWSEEDIAVAFRKFPPCMMVSEDKINSVMEFWVNKMCWKTSLLANRPLAFSYSLEKRVAPRCEVYRFLASNGLINPANISVTSVLHYTDNSFRERFINPHKEVAPDILKLYERKLNLAT